MMICSFILDIVFVFHVKARTCLNVYCQQKGKEEMNNDINIQKTYYFWTRFRVEN